MGLACLIHLANYSDGVLNALALLPLTAEAGKLPEAAMLATARQFLGLPGVAPDGQLLRVSIARPSGIGPIDRAVLAAVRATRLPAFIGDMPRHPVTFDLSVRLRN